MNLNNITINNRYVLLINSLNELINIITILDKKNIYWNTIHSHIFKPETYIEYAKNLKIIDGRNLFFPIFIQLKFIKKEDSWTYNYYYKMEEMDYYTAFPLNQISLNTNSIIRKYKLKNLKLMNDHSQSW